MGAVVYQDDQHVIAVCANAVLTYSIHAPNPEFLAAWSRTVDMVVNLSNGPLLVMTIIAERVQPPDEASRKTIRETVLRNASHIHAFAYVVEGEGFAAAAVRGALSLIGLAARYTFPQKVFGHVEDAVPWMLSRPSPGDWRAPHSARLTSVASSLREQLRAIAAAG